MADDRLMKVVRGKYPSNSQSEDDHEKDDVKIWTQDEEKNKE